VTARTKGIIINLPCNPTGVLVSEDDLAIIAQEARAAASGSSSICVTRSSFTIGRRTTCPRAPEVLSRSRGSLRIGFKGVRDDWLAVRLDDARRRTVVAAQSAVQSHSTSNVSSITQKAAVAALDGAPGAGRCHAAEYRTRRDNLHQWLAEDPRLICCKPAGAFYRLSTSAACSRGRLPHVGRLRRGAAERGAPSRSRPAKPSTHPVCIRISYATSMETLREAAGAFSSSSSTNRPPRASQSAERDGGRMC
jgi:histidinol-phosphate/aromatic aminotransferase/cobyric acid decarboxylase-like protein